MLNLSAIPVNQPLKIIIGAGEQRYQGWIATQQNDLDLLLYEDWALSARKPIS